MKVVTVIAIFSGWMQSLIQSVKCTIFDRLRFCAHNNRFWKFKILRVGSGCDFLKYVFSQIAILRPMSAEHITSKYRVANFHYSVIDRLVTALQIMFRRHVIKGSRFQNQTRDLIIIAFAHNCTKLSSFANHDRGKTEQPLHVLLSFWLVLWGGPGAAGLPQIFIAAVPVC